MRRWLYLAAKFFGVGPPRCYFVPSLHWAVAPFRGMWGPRAWIFDGVLVVRVPVVSVLEDPGHGCWEPMSVSS
jgi:hypothetical protein